MLIAISAIGMGGFRMIRPDAFKKKGQTGRDTL